MITVDPRSLGAIAEIRRQMIRLLQDLSRDVTEDTAQAVFEKAREAADRHTKTGALVRSLRLRRRGNNQLEVYHNLQEAPHALFVHWGTKRHVIRPKQNRKNPHLRWAGPNGYVFAKIVRHPGYKGDPYLIRARDAVAQQFSRIAGNVWDRLAGRNYNTYRDV